MQDRLWPLTLDKPQLVSWDKLGIIIDMLVLLYLLVQHSRWFERSEKIEVGVILDIYPVHTNAII